MVAASSSSTRKPIRPHRKSRAGCGTCKRRKVKCNEEKPCSNCVRFGLPCDLAPEAAHVEYGAAPLTRRGRGRPRKVWTTASLSRTPPTSSTPVTPEVLTVSVEPAPINLDNTELFLHFVTTTAATLAGNGSPDMHRFWTCNAPRIGLTHTFVLHFIFASAAFHLVYLASEQERQTPDEGDKHVDDTISPLSNRQSRSNYLILAQQHLTAGIAAFSAQLSQPGHENCGALYLGAVLTSYCTFAAGPTSPDDLLVCTVKNSAGEGGTSLGSSSPASWMPFVHGVRLMHQSFSPDLLFAGRMEPLRLGPPLEPLKEPACARDSFPRLDWEGALDGLRGVIASGGAGTKRNRTLGQAAEDSTTAAICLKALDALIGIYAATYGRRSGSDDQIAYHGPPENQYIFGWLYRLDPEFLACVRTLEPHALLVLAHYAVLLNEDAVRGGWYVKGWREHIITRAGDLLVDDECKQWMRWPAEQAAPEGERSGGGQSG